MNRIWDRLSHTQRHPGITFVATITVLILIILSQNIGRPIELTRTHIHIYSRHRKTTGTIIATGT